MTDEAKRCVETCREWYQAFTNFGRGDERSVKDLLAVGNMIESLAAELEQVKRERDAAVEDMQKTPITLCNACAHYHTAFPCAGGKYTDKIHLSIACSMFEWRGVKEDT